MAEFTRPSGRLHFLRSKIRNLALAGMILLVAGVFLVTGPNAERLGDRFQITLPLAALGCAIAEGRGVQLVGRYLLLEIFIKTPKHTLGTAPINMRPNGGTAGFPSGHTAVATFGATALVQTCLKNSPAAQAIAIMAAGFTGTSRVDANKHTIWQVLAGATLGFLIQFLSLRAFDRFVRRIAQKISGLFSRQKGGTGLSVLIAATALTTLSPQNADAEVWIDGYIGTQSADPSHITGDDPEGARDFDFRATWDTHPFVFPPQGGFRAIVWRQEKFGWFLDYNHTKVYADNATLGDSGTSGGFQILEFTDGINTITAGPIWRWPDAWGPATPFVAAGIGYATPHVEVITQSGSPYTYEYQPTGPSLTLAAGASIPVSERVNMFSELKIATSQLNLKLDGGGHLDTSVTTYSINIGVRIRLRK